jgi:hypothetical protein
VTDQPLVLGVHLVRGWEEADDTQRRWALGCPGLVALWLLAQLIDHRAGGAVVVLTAVTVGPKAFAAAARVVRPHVGDSPERRWRHALSAAGGCFGAATLMSIALGEGVAATWLWFPATLMLAVTLPWGVVALLVRAAQTAVPTGPPRLVTR